MIDWDSAKMLKKEINIEEVAAIVEFSRILDLKRTKEYKKLENAIRGVKNMLEVRVNNIGDKNLTTKFFKEAYL
jgi:hypothetical protein